MIIAAVTSLEKQPVCMRPIAAIRPSLRFPIADDRSGRHYTNMIAVMILLATAPTLGCDLAYLSSARAVYEALGQRAIKIVVAASTTGPKADVLLADLVDQSASFDLIIGDVGSPGTGVAGARALANAMKADEFRFLGWDYRAGPANACGKQAVTVDFVSNRDRRISQIEFTFERARLIAAKGWQRSFLSGPLAAAALGRNGS